MKWQPKTEDEVQQSQLCGEGKAPFTVMECGIVVSKSAKNAGKEMMKLKLNIHADDGYDYHVYDYIAPWFMEHKFRHFFFSIGLGADYDAGKTDALKIKDREGWCDVGIQKAKGEYKSKNTIRDYVPENEAAKIAEKAAASGTPPEQNDVPF